METIETQEFITSHGRGRVDYNPDGTIRVLYRMSIDGQLLEGQFIVDLFAARLYGPGAMAFLKRSFERYMIFPAPNHHTPDNMKAMAQHREFIFKHGQEIIDKARELGLMDDESKSP